MSRLVYETQNRPSPTTGGRGRGSSGDANVIYEPADFLSQHAQRTGSFFARNPTASVMGISSKTSDAATIAAMGIGELIGNKRVASVDIKKDGSYVKLDDKGNQIGVGTVEEMYQKFKERTAGIKGGVDKSGKMADGFQRNTESGLIEIFGTISPKEAFRQAYNEGAGISAPSQSTLGADEIEVTNPNTGKVEVWNTKTGKQIR
jgi:hypothetical protein